MINLITREQYFDVVGKKNTNYYHYQCLEEQMIKGVEKIDSYRLCYFRFGEEVFTYLIELGLLLLPKQGRDDQTCREICGRICRSELTLDNWKIRKVGEDIPYTLNVYIQYHSESRGTLYDFEHGYWQQGTYVIEDTESEYVQEFYVKSINRYDNYFTTSIAFPGVENLKTPSETVYFKDKFIKTILINNGGDYKVTNTKSESDS